MICSAARGFFLSVAFCAIAATNAAAWHTALTHRTHDSITSALLQESMFFSCPGNDFSRGRVAHTLLIC